MERNKFIFRTSLIGFCMVAIVAFFIGMLYFYQIKVGVDTVVNTEINTYVTEESIPAARGQIISSDGTVLIGNKTEYQVFVDFTDIKDYETQVYVARRLLQLCQELGIEWRNDLPISESAPYIFTNTDGEVYSYEDSETGKTVKTRLGRMCEAMEWKESSSASELMDQMKETFGIYGVDDASARNLLGILYSCQLRCKEILWTDYRFAADVGIDFISIVKEENLPGVEVKAASIRNIETTLAAHLLGQVGYITAENWDEGENYKAQGYDMDAQVGLSGVEYAFESYLRGTKGIRRITRDSNDDIVDVEEVTKATAGSDVELTLDMGLQHAAEASLDKRVPKLNNGEGGGAVAVVDIKNGSVLACASWPTYNPITMEYNDRWTALSPLFNRALQGAYSPGSTYKMVTATAGLETGVITPYTEIQDTGVIDYYGTPFRCWIYRESEGNTTHGMENVSDALQDSCNIFFYTVGIEVGIDTLNEFARDYGLGVASGIELTENVGVNAGPEHSQSVGTTWYGGNTLSAAIGQSDNLFNPLQIANYVATLVNGGNRYAAHLLKSVTAEDGTVTEYEPKVLNTVKLSDSSLSAIKQGMRRVVEHTPLVRQAFSSLEDYGILVGAKTGSAQVSGQENANGLFVCFAPYDDPQIAICVAVEKGGSGAATSVIAADIMEYYFGLTGERDLLPPEDRDYSDIGDEDEDEDRYSQYDDDDEDDEDDEEDRDRYQQDADQPEEDDEDIDVTDRDSDSEAEPEPDPDPVQEPSDDDGGGGGEDTDPGE